MVSNAKTDNERRDDGTFWTRYDQRGLYDLVVAVASVADPQYPDRVSQRVFDDARATAGYPEAPSARAICMRLDTAWLWDLARPAFPYVRHSR